MKMKAPRRLKNALISLFAGLGGLVVLSGTANALAVPPCVEPATCLKFGAFEVYSLEFLNFYTGTSDYYVQASSGHIKDLTVVGTGVSGVPATTNLPGIDDAYETPDGNTISFVSTKSQGDTAGDFVGDGAFTWDARVDALTGFLGGEGLQFFFGFNEGDGNTVPLPDQDLLVWASVTLFDDDDLISPLEFIFDGTNPNPLLEAETKYTYTDPDGDTLDYAHVHGEICVDDTLKTLIHLGECDGSEAGDWMTINQDLGINQAAFMARSNALDDALYAGIYDYLQIDFKLAEVSSGYEQIFISTGERQTDVPEPGTLALLGAGLAGLGFARRRCRRR